MDKLFLTSLCEPELKSLFKTALSELVQELLKENFTQKGIEEDDLIGQKEACRLLKVSATSLWSWRKEGKINYKKIGRKVYYSKKEIQTIHQTSKG